MENLRRLENGGSIIQEAESLADVSARIVPWWEEDGVCRTGDDVLPGPIAKFLQGYVPVKIRSHKVTVGEPGETPSIIQTCPCILIDKVKGGRAELTLERL